MSGWLSDEHKKKISEALTGRPKSEEHRRNLSIARMGRFMGEDNPKWRGGRCVRGDGYTLVYAPDHPFPSQGKHLKRYLGPKEVVHHLNGDPSDNRLSNLALFSTHADHVRYEAAVKRERKAAA